MVRGTLPAPPARPLACRPGRGDSAVTDTLCEWGMNGLRAGPPPRQDAVIAHRRRERPVFIALRILRFYRFKAIGGGRRAAIPPMRGSYPIRG